MKEKFIHYYMKMAHLTSSLSVARRLQVGCIIVKDNRILSQGYNGTPSGWDNNCEDVLPDGTLQTKSEVIHAERNSLDKLARSSGGGSGASLFVTHAPCVECAKSIYNAGILEVFYSSDYRTNDGIKFLEKCGIKVQKIVEL